MPTWVLQRTSAELRKGQRTTASTMRKTPRTSPLFRQSKRGRYPPLGGCLLFAEKWRVRVCVNRKKADHQCDCLAHLKRAFSGFHKLGGGLLDFLVRPCGRLLF